MQALVSLASDEVALDVTSRAGREELATAMVRSSPALRLRRTANGVRVPLDAARALEGIAGLELHWDPDARRSVDERRRIASIASDLIARSRKVAPDVLERIAGELERSALTVTLDRHQVENVARLTLPDGWGGCVFDEQGTGKTVTTIAVFDQLVEAREIETLLLVAPKSMVGEWREEFARHAGDLYDVRVVRGTRSRRAAEIHSGADVLVLGYETAVAHEEDLRLLARRTRCLLVVDESFNVKNADARRSETVRRVRERCRRCLVLCGTPAPNSPRDVIAQFDLVDLGYTFSGFRPSGDPDRDRETIRKIIEERGLFTRNLKVHVLPDLPGRHFHRVEVALAPQQQRAYNAALEDLIIDLRATDENEFRRRILSFLERRASLLRICSNPASLVPDYDEIPAKLAALDDIVEEVLGRGDKLVIWSFFRTSLDAIAARFARFGVARIDGSVAEVDERRDAVRSFQHDDETRIFVGNPAAAGAGITLHAARTAVYESMSNQAAHWMQSLDRIHRRGQRRDCDYIFLTAKDTIEEDEFERVLAKAAAQADLLGDPSSDVVSRDVLLEELLARTTR